MSVNPRRTTNQTPINTSLERQITILYTTTNLYNYAILNRTLSGKIASKLEQTSTNTDTFYQYTYDIAGRLTEVKTNGQTTEQYKYAPQGHFLASLQHHNGNRLEATVNNTTTKAYYTIEDQLEVYGQNTYRYDDDGYLQEKTTPEGSTTYSYGTLGELKQVTTPTSTGSVTVVSYKHNANNQRVEKLIDGTVTEKYLWADLTTLLAIYDSNDTLKQRFEYANDRMPISMTDANNIKYYLHYDQVGTLKAISDINGNIVKTMTYDTFGNVLTDSNPTLKVPFGFAGGLYDVDTKLTRFGYRDYDAYVGKWTAKDPIGFSGGDSNLYGYVLGDPVDYFDPTGKIIPLLIEIGVMGEVIYEFSESLKWYVYKTHLHFNIDQLIFEIQFNCGCSVEERRVCDERIAKILAWYVRHTGGEYIEDFSL